ncbi:MAG: hypothetical protein SGILL_007323, partial [Bacillariaceae sp.]
TVTLELSPDPTSHTSDEEPPGDDAGTTSEIVRMPESEDNPKDNVAEEGVNDDTPPSNDDADSLNSYDEPSCTICFAPLEEGDRIGDLPCNHEFHVDCLKTWVQRKNACPLCNVPIGKRSRRAPPAHEHPAADTTDSNNDNNNQADEEEVAVDDFTQYYRDRNGRRRRRGRQRLSSLPMENRRIGVIGVMMDWDEEAETRPRDEYGEAVNTPSSTR